MPAWENSPRDENGSDPMKYWEIIADNLSKAGWSLGWVSAVDLEGRTIWIVDAHRDDGQRFVVRLNRRVICIGRRRTWTLGYVLHRNNSIFTKAL